MSEPRRARARQIHGYGYVDRDGRIIDKLYMVSTQGLAYERYADGNLEKFKLIEMPEEPIARRPPRKIRQDRSPKRRSRKK